MMMQGIRKAGQSLAGKIIISVMFGFLILSFAIWGVGDIFQGYGRNFVAKVGSTEIGLEQMRAAYQTDVQRLQRQQRRPISPEVARAIGLDRQVLSRLVNEAALDQTAQKLGLAVSDDTIRNLIFDDPNFRDAGGRFSAARFNELLRSNDFTEQSYVRAQRSAVVRQELAEGVIGGFTAPVALLELGNRLRNEQRAVSYAMMPPASAGEIATPADDVLQRYFDERKASFVAPEYRTASVLALSAETIADAAKITDEAARAHYEAVKAQRFGTPERRTVQRIGFATPEEAAAAKARIDAGESFDVIATEKGIAGADLTLGTFNRTELFDPAVRDAVFALAENTVSAPVQSAFGPVLLRVTVIEPEQVKAFDAVADEVRRELALLQASQQITDLHDKIEDQRAAARPLAEIASQFGLKLDTFGPADAALRRPDGSQAQQPPGGNMTVEAIFRSDIGVDNEALRLPNNAGYVWFEVGKIDPSRQRSFAEAKSEVETQWRSDEVASRLSARARELTQKIEAGEDFAAVVQAAGLTAAQQADIPRQGATGPLEANVVSLIFGTPVGKAGSAATADGGRILFRVDSATVPPYVRTTQEAENFAQLIGNSASEDILTQYVNKIQADLGVSVNEAAFRNATGGAQN